MADENGNADCIRELLTPERVLFLENETKKQALDKLVDLLGESEAVQDTKALRKAIFEREKVLSTGIGLGIAVPHAKIAKVSSFVMGVGICPEGLDYESLDGDPVKIVVMIAGPEGAQQRYLKILAHVTLMLKNRQVREDILGAEGAQQVYDILTSKQAGS